MGTGKSIDLTFLSRKARHFERYPWHSQLAGQRELWMTSVQSKAPTSSSRVRASILTILLKSKAFGGMTDLDEYANKPIALPALEDSSYLETLHSVTSKTKSVMSFQLVSGSCQQQ